MKKTSFTTIIELFNIHNKNILSQVGKGKAMTTYIKYETVKSHLQLFIEKHYRKPDFFISEIDIEFITDFELYLIKSVNLSINTVSRYLELLRRILNVACENNILADNPFSQYRIKKQAVVREYLTEEELCIVLSKKFSIKRLDQVRDIFIFSCYTGLTYSDLSNMTSNNLHYTDKSEKVILKIYRPKTNNPAIIPLLSVANKIINKYSGELTDGQVLPLLSNQKMNSYLKEVGEISVVRKNLTFGLARNTFVATIAYPNGIPIEIISKILGHSNINATSVMIPPSYKTISQEMDKLDKALKDINKVLIL